MKKKAAQDEVDSWGNFTSLARRLFAVPKHELDEEIAKEQAQTKADKPAQKLKPSKQKKAA